MPTFVGCGQEASSLLKPETVLRPRGGTWTPWPAPATHSGQSVHLELTVPGPHLWCQARWGGGGESFTTFLTFEQFKDFFRNLSKDTFCFEKEVVSEKSEPGLENILIVETIMIEFLNFRSSL